MALVFEVLAKLSILPFEFFHLVYPVGDNRLTSPELGAASPADLPGEAGMLAMVRQHWRRLGPRTPKEYSLRLGERVQREIQRNDVSVASVSRKLGLASTTLGQALRGQSQLTLFHALAALEAVNVHPGRVLLSVFLENLEDPIRQEAREKYLLKLEKRAFEADEGFLAKRARQPATTTGDEATTEPTDEGPEPTGDAAGEAPEKT